MKAPSGSTSIVLLRLGLGHSLEFIAKIIAEASVRPRSGTGILGDEGKIKEEGNKGATPIIRCISSPCWRKNLPRERFHFANEILWDPSFSESSALHFGVDFLISSSLRPSRVCWDFQPSEEKGLNPEMLHDRIRPRH